MKLFCTAVSCLLFLSSCTTPTPPPEECEKFRNGKFTGFADAVGSKLLIIRQDSMQTELFEETGDSLNLKVQWISPCRYELTLLLTTFPDKQMLGKKIIADIIKTTPNYYIFKATMVGVATYQDTLFKYRKPPQVVK